MKIKELGNNVESIVGYQDKYNKGLFIFENVNGKLVKKKVFEIHREPTLKDICEELNIYWKDKSNKIFWSKE